ncbi:uncharacterized protein LOC110447890 isoform X2 [Mizuhopecten yessoensis]|uniref:Ig-like domain-containing protein n=1 Tax=Mizuhopecten yessoensis TaxID=6573 RepID=A0A210QUB3_MIZYE|nr:uncharacterized protein LOC110447890 isoform X2 [Mizuhopecten yessoensis]OWF52338.1 hypothetical protein KP79_PYT20196 [Mizuhopecten yessoensis]
MKVKGGHIIWFNLAVLYGTVNVSPLPYCKDQWRNNPSENVSTTGPCKIEEKLGSAVDMYCDVDSSKFSSISWFHEFRGNWVPIVTENNPKWRPTVYLAKGNKKLTLLSTYIDNVNGEELDADSLYNKNTNGLYRCKAVAETEHDLHETRTIELELYECARRQNVFVHLTLNKVLTDLGRNVTSSCVADYGCYSVKPYSADWYLQRGPNYTKVSDLKGGRYHVTSNVSNAGRHIVTTLTIDDIQKVDFGDSFVCIVLNSSNTAINHLHIKRVDVVNKRSPFPVRRVLIPVGVLAFVVILVFCLLFISRNGKVRLYIRSRYYDAKPQNTNKVFIFYDEEEKVNEDGLSMDYVLAEEISTKLGDNYEVTTSATQCQPGQVQSGNPFEGCSTSFIILPDLMDTVKFKEMDSCVSRLYNSNAISLRYLTVIDRSEENMKEAPEGLNNTFLLSKSLLHVTRPAKHDTERQRLLFYETLKKRTAPLPQNQEAQGNNVCSVSRLCFCIRGKNHVHYAQAHVNLIDAEV